MRATLVIFIVCFASVTLADDFKTIDGKEYKNVTVKRVESDGIVLSGKSGISKVYFTELPKEVRQRFDYDAAAAENEQQAKLPEDFKTIDGTEYKNVTVKQVEPDGIVVTSKSRILKLYFAELPPEIQRKYGYDPAVAANYQKQA
jgi:hypothetical protein